MKIFLIIIIKIDDKKTVILIPIYILVHLKKKKQHSKVLSRDTHLYIKVTISMFKFRLIF